MHLKVVASQKPLLSVFKTHKEFQAFVDRIMPLEDPRSTNYFDLPSASRLLTGILRSFNEYSAGYSSASDILV